MRKIIANYLVHYIGHQFLCTFLTYHIFHLLCRNHRRLPQRWGQVCIEPSFIRTIYKFGPPYKCIGIPNSYCLRLFWEYWSLTWFTSNNVITISGLIMRHWTLEQSLCNHPSLFYCLTGSSHGQCPSLTTLLMRLWPWPLLGALHTRSTSAATSN